LHVHHIYNWKLKECSTTTIDISWAYSHVWGSLTIGVSLSSTPFPSIGSSFKSKPKWTSLPRAKSTNSIVLYFCINNFLPYQWHVLFNRHLFTSKVQREDEICQFICCSFHSWFLTFIIYGKISTSICMLNLGILQLFPMIEDSSFSTLKSTT
jgi:hypothetical protein